jgi:hypothetical protein
VKRAPLILRWDLDKTYLDSHFESLRSLIRIPFQKAKDKVAVPGVSPLIKGMRRTIEERGGTIAVYFLSASPPQIGAAIREKLALDGIAYDGITFKDQVRHLMYARFDAVLEHVGYKLERLLASARASPAGSIELLFGDDWESDPFVYSLYADILARRMGADEVDAILRCAGVSRHYGDPIRELIEAERPRVIVGGIFILRQRPARASDLDAFGPRLVWFDNYFECALTLWERRILDASGVSEVVADIGLDSARAATSFRAVCERRGGDRATLGPLRCALQRSGVLEALPRGPLLARLVAPVVRWMRARSPILDAGPLPDYARLVERWSYRGRKEAIHERDENDDDRTDDGG